MELDTLITSLSGAYELKDRIENYVELKRRVEGRRIRLVQDSTVIQKSSGAEKYRKHIIEGTIVGMDEQLGGVELEDVEVYIEKVLIQSFPEGNTRTDLRRTVLDERNHQIVSKWQSAESLEDEDDGNTGDT